jgi:hypothetical protein
MDGDAILVQVVLPDHLVRQESLARYGGYHDALFSHKDDQRLTELPLAKPRTIRTPDTLFYDNISELP